MEPLMVDFLRALRAEGVSEYQWPDGSRVVFASERTVPYPFAVAAPPPEDNKPDNSMPTREELAAMKRRFEMPPEGGT